jgi:hypothetical protein
MVWLRYPLSCLLGLATLFFITAQAQAQIVVVRNDSAHTRLSPPDSTGLRPTTRINHAMFAGIRLSGAQADSIDRLRTQFLTKQRTLLPNIPPGATWDAATKVRMQSFLETERAAYRAVLTPAQRRRFDQNTEAILRAWRRAESPHVPTSNKAGTVAQRRGH